MFVPVQLMKAMAIKERKFPERMSSIPPETKLNLKIV